MTGSAARFWIPYFIAALFAVALLAGCSGEPPRTNETRLAELDKQLAGDDVDPALTSALEDQITVDPALTQQSNKLAVRPAPMPAQALYPPPGGEGRTRTSGQPGARSSAHLAGTGQSGGQSSGDCMTDFDYNAAWAKRMPERFPVLPGAKLTDAAGNDKAGCRMRVATFVTNVPPRQVLDWYTGRAAGGGFTVQHQLRDGDHILSGARGDQAYYLIVSTRGAGGSEVALFANNGA